MYACIYIVYTRGIPAFGGISLALRESGASGATFGRLRRPRWETAAFGGGERKKKINKKNWGAPVGPLAYAAFGGEKIKKNWGAFGAPNGF